MLATLHSEMLRWFVLYRYYHGHSETYKGSQFRERAKYTRRRTPVELVYFEDCESETRARRRELELKGWRRDKKEALIHGFPSSVLRVFLRISGQ